ncbi:Core-2/I-Branching enzyme [Ostertagia ostertagi]
MLSSFYRPQNEYCIAVSGGCDTMFKIIMDEVDACFDNIRVLHRPPIEWGSFEIINSTNACLELLSNSTTPWKYFQKKKNLAYIEPQFRTPRQRVSDIVIHRASPTAFAITK